MPVDGVSPTGADSLAASGPDPRRSVRRRRLPGHLARPDRRRGAPGGAPERAVDSGHGGRPPRRGDPAGPSAARARRAWSSAPCSTAISATRRGPRSPPPSARALDGDATLMWRILGAGADDDASRPTRQSDAAFLASVCQDTNLPWQSATPIDARRRAGDDQAVALGAGVRGPVLAARRGPREPERPLPRLAGGRGGRHPGRAPARHPRARARRRRGRAHPAGGRRAAARAEPADARSSSRRTAATPSSAARTARAPAVRRFFAGDPVGRPCSDLSARASSRCRRPAWRRCAPARRGSAPRGPSWRPWRRPSATSPRRSPSRARRPWAPGRRACAEGSSTSASACSA